MKLPKEDPCFRLRRKEQKQQIFDERQPADDGNDNRKSTTRPDIVRENHRKAGAQSDDAEDQHHRWILKKPVHCPQHSLSASHHG